MLEQVSTNTLMVEKKFELFEDRFHTMLKMQSEMTEPMTFDKIQEHLRKEALLTFRKNVYPT